jgi:hypothetical protein
VFRWAARALAEFFKSRASLVAENLCLRQQLLVLQRRHPRKFVNTKIWCDKLLRLRAISSTL